MIAEILRNLTNLDDITDNSGAGTDGYVWSYNHGTGKTTLIAQSGGGGGGTPGGSDTQVQFNNAGSFAGDTGFTYASGTDALTVAGLVNTPIVQATSDSATGLQFRSSGGTSFLDVATSTGWVVVKGYNTSTTTANAANGELRLGVTEANQGRIHYEGVTGFDLYIENTSDTVAGDIIFRTRVAGTPVTPLTLSGEGTATFGGDIVASLIKPASDSSTALQFTNADESTVILNLNSSNGNAEFIGDVRLENAARISGKDTGGTYRTLFQFNGSDQVVLGATVSAVTRTLIQSGGSIYFSPGAVQGRWTTDGYLSVGQNTNGTAFLDVAASTTSASSLRIRSGTAPTSPNAGDLWFDGTNLKFYDGSTERTLSWT